jgi:ABC-type multidrug transport system ATPase subunit
VRREFIQTVIGAYQEADSARRTVFVSTHLIAEFEGLIDEFTIVENGKAALTLPADEARGRFQRIRARFAGAPPAVDFVASRNLKREGRELEITVNGDAEMVLSRIKSMAPESVSLEGLTLEEIFMAVLK